LGWFLRVYGRWGTFVHMHSVFSVCFFYAQDDIEKGLKSRFFAALRLLRMTVAGLGLEKQILRFPPHPAINIHGGRWGFGLSHISLRCGAPTLVAGLGWFLRLYEMRGTVVLTLARSRLRMDRSGAVAEAAGAVGVVLFGGSVAMGFGALCAGADFTVGEGRLVFFEDLAGRGDLVSVGGEDDVLEGVFVGGVEEGSGVEVGHAGAVGEGEGAGDGRLDAAFEGGEGDEMEVELDGGAVVGEGERESDGAVAGASASVLVGLGVEAAVAGCFEGGLGAGSSGGEDVSAKGEHGACPWAVFRDIRVDG
jgi:hypothetical protein